MALGEPVVATSGGGTNEIVLDNKTGFLIKPSDSDELAKKLEILLNDSDLRTKAWNCRQGTILDEFSIDQMVRKCLDAYNNVLKD